MKKDRRVAVTRSNLRKRPAEIVAPEREMPGSTGDRAWNAPMMRASLTVTSFMPLVRFCWRSASHMTADQMMRAPAITHRERTDSSMNLLSSSPTTATGIEPRMMPQPSV